MHTVSPPSPIDHVLLTRFNLPTPGVEGLIRAEEGWLHNRVELFERYCAPSVANQTQPVSWIIYFDPDSPDWLLERLHPFVRNGLFKPILRASVTQDQLLSDISETVPHRSKVLLTTNLDNDDGLAADFCERLRSVQTAHPRVAIYMVHGLIKSAEGLFSRTDRRNAFCSVLEPWDGAVTAWAEYHNEFPRVMPVVELDGPPSWLQVVHGANVSNRVRGRLVSPRAHQARFGNTLDDAPTPVFADITKDMFVGVPIRAARDGARSAVRLAALRLLGKDRYQRAKLRISMLRRPA
jgi:putative rhamnosyltransferase